MRNRKFVDGSDRDSLISEQLPLHHVVLTDSDTAVPDLSRFAGVIHCSITPFGLEGPWAGRAAGDLVIQALSGFMELTGTPGRPPIRMGARVLPLMAGALAAVQIMAGLLRDGQGAGASIDMAVFDTALNTLTYIAPLYLTFGQLMEEGIVLTPASMLSGLVAAISAWGSLALPAGDDGGVAPRPSGTPPASAE